MCSSLLLVYSWSCVTITTLIPEHFHHPTSKQTSCPSLAVTPCLSPFPFPASLLPFTEFVGATPLAFWGSGIIGAFAYPAVPHGVCWATTSFSCFLAQRSLIHFFLSRKFSIAYITSLPSLFPIKFVSLWFPWASAWSLFYQFWKDRCFSALQCLSCDRPLERCWETHTSLPIKGL